MCLNLLGSMNLRLNSKLQLSLGYQARSWNTGYTRKRLQYSHVLVPRTQPRLQSQATDARGPWSSFHTPICGDTFLHGCASARTEQSPQWHQRAVSCALISSTQSPEQALPVWLAVSPDSLCVWFQCTFTTGIGKI